MSSDTGIPALPSSMTDPRSARLIDVALSTLRDEVLPEIADAGTRIKIDHVTRLLLAVSAKLSRRESGLRAFLSAAEALVAPGSARNGAGGDDLEERRRCVEADICASLPALLDSAAAGGDGITTLQALLDIERQFYISQDPDVARGSGVVYRGGRIEDTAAPANDAAWPQLDAASLTGYMQRRTGRSDVTVTDVGKIPGGFSKDTIFFTLRDDADKSARQLVIRKDLPVPLIQKTVVNEFGLLTRLFEARFPVAEPMWLEADASLFGGAFLVSRRVGGTSDHAKWASDPDRARAACLELAGILARLHAFGPGELGFDAGDPGLSSGAVMEQEIKSWIGLFHSRRSEAFPLQELPLVWLAANIPRELYQRPARLVHGDVGFHNLMFDDAGRVTALLDWEFSGLGDPTQDMCFVRQFVESLMPWPEFLQAYLDAGGEPPCEEAEFFYRLWTKTRNAVGCVDAQTLFDTTTPGEMRFALAGHIFAPYMFVDQCEALIEHLAQ